MEKASDEARLARARQRKCSHMFQFLGLRAKRALSSICDENVSSPLVSDDAGYLSFFTNDVACLDGGAMRARRLIEDNILDLLACAFSHVFSHLLRYDPHFDFDVAIAPIPGVIQVALAS